LSGYNLERQYQALINAALRQSTLPENALVTLGDLRRVLRKEFPSTSA